jgi:tetratricopeptide (TPR) repeat protein
MSSRSAQVVYAAVALLAASCSRDPKEVARRYTESGDKYVEQKKYPDAIIQYRNAVAADGSSGPTRYKLANAYSVIGDQANAMREYVRAADLMPADQPAQIRAGQYLLRAQQYPEAKARAAAVLEKDPKNLEGLVLMGNALAALKDFDGAISEIEEAIDQDPKQTLWYANLGLIQMANENIAAAKDAFERAVKADPKSLVAHTALANFRWSQKQFPEAETELQRAYELDPKSAPLLKALATFYVGTRKPDQAERYLSELAALNDDPAPKITLADFYLGYGKIDKATTVLKQLLEQHPDYADADLRLAGIDYAGGRRDEGQQRVDAVLKREPTNEQAVLLKARFLIIERNFKDALKLTTTAVAANPRSRAGLYTKSVALAGVGDLDQAITTLRELLKFVPSEPQVQIKLAEFLLAKGDAKAAEDAVNDALRLQPQSGVAHLVHALALTRQGKVVPAETELTALSKFNQASPDVQAAFGQLYLSKRDVSNARIAYARAFELNPESLDALGGLVQADLMQHKPADARARVDARLEKDPDNPGLLSIAGKTYVAVGDADKAEAAFRKILEKDPDALDAYASLATIYMMQNRLDQAKQQYEQLAKGKPEVAVVARTMLGTILLMQKDYPGATTQYQKALELDAKAAVAANNLAWVYSETGGNLDQAAGLAQAAKSHLPKSAEVSDTLGWIYYKKGLTDLAISTLREGVDQNPSDPTIQYHLGLAYLKKGDAVQGKRSLQRALQLKPDFEGAADARRALEAGS